MASIATTPNKQKGTTSKADTTARTELPTQPAGEVERREREDADLKDQGPVMPAHTAAEVAPSEYLDREEIARLAYSYFLERQGREEGSADDDWLRAERELSGRNSAF